VALAVQVSLGLSNVVFGLPLVVAVAHNAGGAALLLTLVLVNYHARTALVRVRAPRFARWTFSLKGEQPWRP
jgi:cytochrome c oxidase assembly protein subunit 15